MNAMADGKYIFASPQRVALPAYLILHSAQLSPSAQDLDADAADRALAPAFAAISADLHKRQPSACGGGCSATQMPFFLRYSSAWVYAAMATTGVSLMEKRKQWQPAVDLLQQLLGVKADIHGLPMHTIQPF